MLQPLDLPEIRAIVAQFLTRHELAICSRVSKEWQQSFEPLVWGTIILGIKGWVFRSKCVSLETFAKHSDQIWKLACRGTNDLAVRELVPLFPRLNDLTLPWQTTRGPFDFLARHRATLTHLCFDTESTPGIQRCQYGRLFWDAIVDLPSLTRLELPRGDLKVKDMDCWLQCWATWSRLTFLRMEDVDFSSMMRHQPFSASALDSSYSDGSLLEGDDTTTITMSTTKIKHLKVLSPLSLQSIKDIFPLLNYCPELETLHLVPIRLRNWEIDTGRVARSLAEYAAACPKLDTLYLGADLTGQDDEILPFLESRIASFMAQKDIATTRVSCITPLKRLTVPQNWFGLRSWQLVQGHQCHLMSFRSLRVRHSPLVTGKMVQEMLCSLPNLDTLSVPWIQDLDLMLDPRPWVSVRLKQLEVCILFSQQSPSQRLLMERLATLRELKHLDVTMNRLHAQLYPSPAAASAPLYFDGRIIGGTVIQPTSFLRFGLGHGLHLLKVWRNLEGLSIDTPQEMTEADIRWILDHWPKLRYLYGSLHTESGQAKSLRDLLIKGGATYVASDPGMYISI